jgi:hypothetical protein
MIAGEYRTLGIANVAEPGVDEAVGWAMAS